MDGEYDIRQREQRMESLTEVEGLLQTIPTKPQTLSRATSTQSPKRLKKGSSYKEKRITSTTPARFASRLPEGGRNSNEHVYVLN